MALMNSLKTYADSKGWEYGNGIIRGELNGYLVTLAQGNRLKTILIPLVGISQEQKETVIGFFREHIKALRLAAANFDNSVLYFRIKETAPIRPADLDQILSSVTQFLYAKQIGHDKFCAICGKGNADITCNIDKIKYYVHESCFNEAKDKAASQAEAYDKVNKKYARGTIGAILGALAGAIPWVVVYVLFGYIAAILGYIIGFISDLGYRKAGGLLGKATRKILILSIVISVIVASFVGEYVYLKEPKDLSVLFSADFYYNLIIGLVFALLGSYNILIHRKGSGKDVVSVFEK